MNVNVKILIFKDDSGKSFDVYAFREEADINEIKNTVEKTFEEECGERMIHEIIEEKYGDLLVGISECEEVEW